MHFCVPDKHNYTVDAAINDAVLELKWISSFSAIEFKISHNCVFREEKLKKQFLTTTGKYQIFNSCL